MRQPGQIRVEEVEVVTPVATTAPVSRLLILPLVVPILRAGLGMLEGKDCMVPTAGGSPGYGSCEGDPGCCDLC